MKIFNLILITTMLCSCASPKTAKKITSTPEEFQLTMDEKNKCFKKIRFFKVLAAQGEHNNKLSLFLKTPLDELCTTYYKESMGYMNRHLGKIAIILEKGHEPQKTQAIISGIKDSLAQVAHASPGSFLIKQVPLHKEKVNQVMNQLILKHRVGLLITWGQKKFISHIQRWQKNLEIPGIFISNKVKKDDHSFHIFPNRTNYALKMIEVLKKKDIKRIAILTPAAYNKTPLLKSIKYLLKKNNIVITHDIEYRKGDFHTYDNACRILFNINKEKRKEELDLIRAKERLKANADGFVLNEKHVFLAAETNFDAILLPDDFQTVHRFAKLFKFYQTGNIPLFGTYQWRSQDLLVPKEKMLQGATFIDFLGNYQSLPITLPTGQQANNMSPTYLTDYKLMGYYTGLIGQMVIKRSGNNIQQLKKELTKATINDNFIKNKKAFKNNRFNWPSFAIEIQDNEFLIGENN